ncbi:hypothetical protein GJ744_003843 [Endocarpon pusillum]|uniref:LSO1/LSO2 domain-containing protein n=1 Tax=Endocarpon pusillum TaxID=364733 RepID=A0A8H7AM27_9EURO|nr:hypothetical protein GJ744_003843 [Endocarpon pusillum]
MRPYSIHPYIRIFIIVHISTYLVVMAGKKGGENTKKVAGNAKKAEVAAQKQAAEEARAAAAETQEWSKGAKGNAKKKPKPRRKPWRPKRRRNAMPS